MRFTPHNVLTLILVVFSSVQVWATEDDPGGSVTVGVQTTSEDGIQDKFREDSLGEQDGLFLERLEYGSSNDSLNLEFDLRFTTGRNGWLDLEATGDNWSGGLNATIVSAWSNTSFSNDFLPSGTPVEVLYPGTTALDPVLGVSEPRTETLVGEAWLTYRFSGFNRVTVRAGARSRDGERVPNIGGFSFSDVGTASFYTTGLEKLDSSSSWFELEGVFEAGPVDLRIEGGILNVDTDRRVRMPAYGQESLLDFNEWRDALDSDTSWLRAHARWRGSKVGVYGAVSYSDTSTEPSGGDRRIDESGSTILEDLALRGGSLDVEAFAAALGVAWSASDVLTFTAALDTRSRDASGELDLFLRDAPVVPNLSAYDEERVGGTIQIKLGTGPRWVRLRVRGTSTDLDHTEERDLYSQATEQTTDRIDARLDAAVRLASAWDLSVWVRHVDVDVDVELGDLWYGYATGDWSRTSTSGALSLSYRGGGVRGSLSVTTGSTDIDSDVPWYDPIFDPSVDLVPVTVDQSSSRFFGSLLWPFATGSLWVEGGWLELEYDMQTAVASPGFAPVSETISGTVAAVGADIAVWRGGTLNAHLEWIDDTDDLGNEILRGHLQLDHELSSRFSLFGRWAYWDFTNDLAPSDDYEVNIFAAGVQVRF